RLGRGPDDLALTGTRDHVPVLVDDPPPVRPHAADGAVEVETLHVAEAAAAAADEPLPAQPALRARVQEHEVGVAAHRQVALAVVETEQPRRGLAGPADDVLQRYLPLQSPVPEEGAGELDARHAGAGRPDVGPAGLLLLREEGRMVGDD